MGWGGKAGGARSGQAPQPNNEPQTDQGGVAQKSSPVWEHLFGAACAPAWREGGRLACTHASGWLHKDGMSNFRRKVAVVDQAVRWRSEISGMFGL